MTLLAALVGFAIGSIPFGYVIGRLFYRTDLRSHGSGNIGAMNALRALGTAGAIAVLVLDALKGFAPVALAGMLLGPPAGAAVAVAAVLGHCYSPWLGWKGGKGVATSFGAVFALSWKVGLIAVGGWIVGALATAYSSVGSLLGSVAAAIAFPAFGAPAADVVYGIFAAIFIAYTHRENIARLRAGSEGPISFLRRNRKA